MYSKGLRVALLGGAAGVGVAVASWWGVRTGEIRIRQDDFSLTIQAVQGALFPAAFAQSPAPVVLNDVTITFGPMSYRAPRIEVTGLKSSKPDLERLFDPDAKETLAERIATLEADEIRIPEIIVSHVLAGVEQRGEMRNLVARRIVRGQVASLGVEAAFTETKGPRGRTVATQGRMVVEELDGPWLASVLTEKSSSEQTARIYGRVSVENMVQTSDQGVVRVARFTGRDFVARRTSTSLLGSLSEMLAMAEPGRSSSPTDAARILAVVGELGGAFDAREAEISNIEATAPADRSDPFAMRVARIGYRGALDGAAAATELENLSVETPDGKGAVATIRLTGFSFKPTFAGLRELSGQDLDNLDPEAFRKLLPTFGQIRVEGVSLAPDTSGNDPKADDGRFSLRSFEVAAGEPVNGIPTSVRLAVDGLTLALPRESDEEGVRTLLDLGYRSVDVSFGSSTTWNPSSRELVLGDISFNGAGMGSFTARGVLGNVSSEAFSADSAIAMVALMESTVRSLDVTLVNGGLFDRFLEREARQRKKTVEAVRREYGTAASLALPAILGSSDQAKILSGAVARFLAKPGRLTVNARAKDPQGLGLAELAGSSTPAAALDRLEIKALAQEP